MQYGSSLASVRYYCIWQIATLVEGRASNYSYFGVDDLNSDFRKYISIYYNMEK